MCERIDSLACLHRLAAAAAAQSASSCQSCVTQAIQAIATMSAVGCKILSFPLNLVKELINSWVTIAVVMTAVTIWPILLFAHYNQRAFRIWYSLAFMMGDRIFLRRYDRDTKTKLFSNLALDYRNDLRVLEIGPGTGTNFDFYPTDTVFKLSTLEYNPHLMTMIDSVRKRYPLIQLQDCLIGDASNMPHVKEESFDVIIATHVFCCIRDASAAAREIYRILKKVGFLKKHS